MKINKNDMPVVMEAPGSVFRNATGFGGMTVAFNEIPAGTDITPLLKGLENDSCHCPHWGYVLEGTIRIVYNDKSEEVVSSGDVFYWPPGHTAIVEEDLKLLDFSPEKEFNEVMTHIGKMMAEMGG